MLCRPGFERHGLGPGQRDAWWFQVRAIGVAGVKWTRLSCHDFVDNQVRLQLFVLAYNLGNFLRQAVLPPAVRHWTLTTLREKLIKIGAKVVRHSRQIIFQMAEVAVPRELFRGHSGRDWAAEIGNRDVRMKEKVTGLARKHMETTEEVSSHPGEKGVGSPKRHRNTPLCQRKTGHG